MTRTLGWSPIAERVEHQRDVNDRTLVFGVCLHTTGMGLNAAASKQGLAPLEYAVRYYTRPNAYAPHYVIGHDGKIVQIANDFERMPHIGMTPADRVAYLNGTWTEKVPAAVVVRWRAAWPGHESPAHLFPSHFPNEDYVGVEMIPTTGTEAAPWRTGLRFTSAQHLSAAALARDVALRHQFPEGWSRTAQLVGHEDVQIVTRHDGGGGWDPGALREAPYFDMAFVRAQAAQRFGSVA